MDYKSGDTIVADEGTFLIVSAKGFNLKDHDVKADFILINVQRGSMEAYTDDLNELWKIYSIREVIPNPNSWERRKKSEEETEDFSECVNCGEPVEPNESFCGELCEIDFKNC